MHASVRQGHDAPGEQPDSILHGALGLAEHTAALERLPGDGRRQRDAVAQHWRPFGERPQPRCAIEPQGRGKYRKAPRSRNHLTQEERAQAP